MQQSDKGETESARHEITNHQTMSCLKGPGPTDI